MTHQALKQFLRNSEKINLPMFDSTWDKLINLTSNVNTPTAQIAQVILQDTPLTAKLLKMANSVYFNRRKEVIRTITKAVVSLGVSTIRSICFTSTLLDKWKDRRYNPLLIDEIAWSFLFAVIVRHIAKFKQLEQAEEMYIGGLFYRLGYLVFWLQESDSQLTLESAMQDSSWEEASSTQERVLGFKLDDLSRVLMKSWQLSPLLNELWFAPSPENASARALFEATEIIVKQLRFNQQALTQVSHHLTKANVNTVQADLLLNEAWGQCLQLFQSVEADHLINALTRTPPSKKNKSSGAISSDMLLPFDDFEQVLPSKSKVSIDKTVLFDVICDLNTQSLKTMNLTELFEFLLEGLQRGAGLTHVAAFTFNQARDGLLLKFCLSWMQRESLQQLKLSKQNCGNDFFDWLQMASEPVWIEAHSVPIIFKPFYRLFSLDTDCFIMPLKIKQKTFGFVFASGGELALTQQAFEVFHCVIIQGLLCVRWMDKT